MRMLRILIVTALSLCSGLLLSSTASAAVDIGISVNIAPPPLPVYVQPAIPGPDYLWSPGYWAWGDGDYYWVPGTWVQAPEPGYLWTPGYWGWADGAYIWHGGYWGTHVGFYGGVNYGFGYGGHGYEGGEWRGGSFFYNRSVNNIPSSMHISNVYNRTVVNNVTVNRVSFNGGKGGVAAQPTQAERAAGNERHLPPVGQQTQHEQAARANPQLRAAANHGAPPIAATAHAGSFSGPGVVRTRGIAAGATHLGQPTSGLSHQAATVSGPAHPVPAPAPHAGPQPPASAQPAVRTFKPSTPGGGPGAGAPPAPKKEEHKAPPEHGGNEQHEH